MSLFGTSRSPSGTHPVKRLPPRYSSCRLERFPNSFGISPVNWLPWSHSPGWRGSQLLRYLTPSTGCPRGTALAGWRGFPTPMVWSRRYPQNSCAIRLPGRWQARLPSIRRWGGPRPSSATDQRSRCPWTPEGLRSRGRSQGRSIRKLRRCWGTRLCGP
ncbi:hypothetical protein GBAR_LOCUS20904 [Geodia barretti]|uniref:Uncharacterized protein n=1 Tax=Geodia barretti TaxID=519541 RepID=A0AA35SYH1_GEOBA|nr:hypothetical protein GBAR_LOCUS20904 [Geodia barretti]